LRNIATTKSINGAEITQSDIEKINQYTRRSLSVDEVYVFSVILCDNEIDRDYERFTPNSLNQMAKLFVGKTGIFDHNPKGKNQSARVFEAEVITETDRQNSLAMPYSYIKAKAYMVKSQKNADLMLDIDAGIKKEVSVSCSVESIICSICGSDQKTEGCQHQKGEEYEGESCHFLLENVTDAYEWSFVAIPAQKNAGVVKGFYGMDTDINEKEMGEGGEKSMRTVDNLVKLFASNTSETKGEVVLSSRESKALQGYISDLKEKSKLGGEYQADLIGEVKRLAFLSGDSLPVEVVDSLTQKMSISELKAFKKSYEIQLEKQANPKATLQLKSQTSKPENACNNEFKL